MAECRDKHFEQMIWAYETGLLDDAEVREFELHVMKCSACRENMKSFAAAHDLVRYDADVRQAISEIANEGPSTRSTEPIELPRRRLKTIIVTAALAVAATIVLLLHPWDLQFRPTQTAIADEPRLAVMYFGNLTDPDDQQQLGEIATNLLITDLSESDYLRVVSDQRLYDILKLIGREDHRRVDREIARVVADSADASLMYIGSILQVQPYIVLTGQLIDVNSGEVLSAQQVTCSSEQDLFCAVDSLSRQLREAITLPVEALQEPDPYIADVTTHSREAYFHYLQGVRHVYRFYNIEAAEDFRLAIESDSTFAMAYYQLSMIAEGGWIDKAMEFIDRASQRESFYIRAQHAARNRDYVLAMTELENLLERYPDEKQALYLLGMYSRMQGDHAKTAEYAERALEVDPLFERALNMLAYTYDELGEYEKAIAALDTYIALAPNEANPHDSRGDICLRNDRVDQAVESYRHAVAIDSSFYHSVQKLAHIYLVRREFDLAEPLYRCLAAHSDPRVRAIGRYYLPYLSLGRGQFMATLEELARSATFDAEKGIINSYTGYKFWLRSQIYSLMGDHEQALAVYDSCMSTLEQVHPSLPFFYMRFYSQLLARNGDFATVESFADSIRPGIDRATDTGWVYHFAMGANSLARGNPQLAIEYLTRGIEINGEPPMRLMLARAYLESGNPAEAVNEYEDLLSDYSETLAFYYLHHILAHYYLGLAYENSHWHERAIEQYEIFLDHWGQADIELAEIVDARERIERLRAGS